MKNKKTKLYLLNIIVLLILSITVFSIFLSTYNATYKAETIQEKITEKIQVKVSPVTYFTETSKLGKDYRNYLQSVYFFVDKKYNDSLITEITANWDYYQIKNLVVTNDFNNGDEKEKNLLFRTLDYKHFSPINEQHEVNGLDSDELINYYKSHALEQEKLKNIVKSKRLPFLEIENLENEEDVLLESSDLNFVRNLEDNLINHKAHYNTPIRNDGKGILLETYGHNKNFFEKFIDYGFNMPIYEENYKQHKLIEVITEDMLKGSDDEISKNLGIQKGQLNKFKKDFFDNKNKRCYIFRFGTGTIKVSKHIPLIKAQNNGIVPYLGYYEFLYSYYDGQKSLSKPLATKPGYYLYQVDTDVYKNFNVIELEMSTLINKEILDENIKDPDQGNIPNVKDPEKHDVEQQNSNITITPGAVKPTENISFLGVDYEKLKNDIKNWFQNNLKNFFNNTKLGKIIKYSLITVASVLALVILTKILNFFAVLFKFRRKR